MEGSEGFEPTKYRGFEMRLIHEPSRDLNLAKACCAALELAMQCQALVDTIGSIENTGDGTSAQYIAREGA